jgi:hypothetical protein
LVGFAFESSVSHLKSTMDWRILVTKKLDKLKKSISLPIACLVLFVMQQFMCAAAQETTDILWKSQLGVRIATTQPGDCSTKVKNGDIVYIRHRGIYGNEPEKMVQFDGDGGQPLRFVVGERRIITGMEVGVVGQVRLVTNKLVIPLPSLHTTHLRMLATSPTCSSRTQRHSFDCSPCRCPPAGLLVTPTP